MEQKHRNNNSTVLIETLKPTVANPLNLCSTASDPTTIPSITGLGWALQLVKSKIVMVNFIITKMLWQLDARDNA